MTNEELDRIEEEGRKLWSGNIDSVQRAWELAETNRKNILDLIQEVRRMHHAIDIMSQVMEDYGCPVYAAAVSSIHGVPWIQAKHGLTDEEVQERLTEFRGELWKNER